MIILKINDHSYSTFYMCIEKYVCLYLHIYLDLRLFILDFNTTSI